MTDEPQTSYSPEVIATYVWDAIKGTPGLADLHRSPLQSLGEKVHLERRGPVRIEKDGDRVVVHVHIVVTADAHVPTMSATLRDTVREYLGRMTKLRVDDVTINVDDIVWETDSET